WCALRPAGRLHRHLPDAGTPRRRDPLRLGAAPLSLDLRLRAGRAGRPRESAPPGLSGRPALHAAAPLGGDRLPLRRLPRVEHACSVLPRPGRYFVRLHARADERSDHLRGLRRRGARCRVPLHQRTLDLLHHVGHHRRPGRAAHGPGARAGALRRHVRDRVRDPGGFQSVAMASPRTTVVGGGLAGLMTTIRTAEAGLPVDLFSIVPVKRSHSVCAQGGINAAVNWKGEGDSPWRHFDDTIYGGDFLANQPPVLRMCEAGPSIVFLLDRMGVMFNRTPEGLLDFRRFGGTKHHRTAFAGATTGQQLLYALDEQVRRFEAAGLVRQFETWEFLSIVKDDAGCCRGIVAIDQRSMEIHAFPAAAVMLATGGPGMVFGKSTSSTVNTGTAAGAAYQQGAHYANGEFIQVHPTATPGDDKTRLLSAPVPGQSRRRVTA